MRTVRIEAGPIGAAVGGRVLVVAGCAVLVSVAGLVASVTLGQFPLPLGDVVAALLGYGSADATLVVRELRLPRALVGLLVGAAFGLAGAIFQAVTRNPLATPDLIGVSAGASAGGATAILLGSTWGAVTAAGAGAYSWVPVGALAGGLSAAAFIYVMAFRDGTITGYRLVLVGLGVHGALSALTGWLLVQAEIDAAAQAVVWLTGSLNGRGMVHVAWVAVALAVLLPLTVALVRPYRLLQFDDDTALALGMPVHRSRIALLVLAVGFAALATAAAGPVPFVALAAPQVARRLAGTAGVPLLSSGLVGAALLLTADVVARLAFAPIDLPVGVVTGAVGAPYLIWVLARTNRVGKGG